MSRTIAASEVRVDDRCAICGRPATGYYPPDDDAAPGVKMEVRDDG